MYLNERHLENWNFELPELVVILLLAHSGNMVFWADSSQVRAQASCRPMFGNHWLEVTNRHGRWWLGTVHRLFRYFAAVLHANWSSESRTFVGDFCILDYNPAILAVYIITASQLEMHTIS